MFGRQIQQRAVMERTGIVHQIVDATPGLEHLVQQCGYRLRVDDVALLPERTVGTDIFGGPAGSVAVAVDDRDKPAPLD